MAEEADDAAGEKQREKGEGERRRSGGGGCDADGGQGSSAGGGGGVGEKGGVDRPGGQRDCEFGLAVRSMAAKTAFPI